MHPAISLITNKMRSVNPQSTHVVSLKKIEKTCINLLKHASSPKNITDFIITQAILRNASDIHIDHYQKTFLVFRIDNILITVAQFNRKESRLLIKAFKTAIDCPCSGLEKPYPAKISTTKSPNIFYNIFIIPFKPFDSVILRLQPPKSSNSNQNHTARHIENIKKPIFIWQMGKVGSTTLLASLKPFSSPLSPNITNLLTNDDSIRYNNIVHTHSIKVLYDFLHSNNEDFIIISLVRELLSRNISSVFQSMCDPAPQNNVFIATKDEFKKLPYDKQEREISNKLHIINNFDHIFNWYNHLFKTHIYFPEVNKYSINIYDKKFNCHDGYQVYGSTTPRIKMMIIRLEDLNNLEQKIGNFLKIDNFRLIKENVSSQKWYSPIYKKFLANYKPQQRDLEKLYNSQFMKYFYSRDQIETFIKRWAKH